jgi:phospholipase/carboxylesterase
LRAWLEPQAQELAAALAALRRAMPPAGLEPLHGQLEKAAAAADDAARTFLTPAPPAEAAPRILASFADACRGLEALYPLRQAIAPLGRLFAEAPLHDRLETLDPPPPEGVSVGMHTAGDEDDERGGFALYVPESYDPAHAGAGWPLIVALHGAFGLGRNFVWTWLREARSRRCLLLAPTSRGTTWSMEEPDVDQPALRTMVSFVGERWKVDPTRVLLTGLSDGGTYALLTGLAEDSPFTHLAVLSGVLHPYNFRRGNMTRASGRRVYFAHGALDWLFPIALAQAARDALLAAGADLTYRELADLSHTYPREENARILRWMDPALALPGET